MTNDEAIELLKRECLMLGDAVRSLQLIISRFGKIFPDKTPLQKAVEQERKERLGNDG